MFLLNKDPKKTAATLVVEIGKGPKEDEGKEGYLAASEAVLKAVEKKDAKGLALALKDFVDICEASHEESEDESEMGGSYPEME